MHRGYKYRIYPNREQERWLKKNIGCCRFVYNQMLGFKKGAYDAMGISMSETELKNVIPSLKRMYPFLKEEEEAPTSKGAQASEGRGSSPIRDFHIRPELFRSNQNQLKMIFSPFHMNKKIRIYIQKYA